MTPGVPRALRILVWAFAAIIVVLLGILLFVPAAHGPAPSQASPLVSPDGHLRVDSPRVGDIVISPAALKGSVTGGGWFFEATFPVSILDGDGTILGQGPVRAEGEWTTTSTVPFDAAITFAAPRFPVGTVVFKKDNPSGLPENDGELQVPVRFK